MKKQTTVGFAYLSLVSIVVLGGCGSVSPHELLVAAGVSVLTDQLGPGNGDDGEQGEPGPPGERGPQGETGEQGATGETGPAGVPGEPGADGADGMDGADGVVGEDGEDGQDGVDGLPGDVVIVVDDCTTICHKGRTLTVGSDSAAESHLENHEGDYCGPCE